jgi:TolB protein
VTPLALARVLLLTTAAVLLCGITTAAGSPINQLTVTTTANLRPAWSPDAKRIAFQRSEADGQYHVYVMDADGGNVRRVTSGNVDDRHPAWNPKGDQLAVDSGDAQREIWLIDVASGQRTQVTRLGAIASFPSWSPDGSKIAFYLYKDGTTDLWMAGRDGSGAHAITQTLASERNQQCTFACHSAAWSPRGDRIAFSDGEHARVLVMAAAAGSVPTSVSPGDERAHFPIYLADGRLVYISEHITLDQSWTDLWALPPEANGARTEVVSSVQAQGPFELSPDGRQLLFASPRSGNFEIYSVTLDDAGKAALAQRLVQGREGDDAATVTAAAASAARAGRSSGPFGENAPYLLGLLAVGLIGVGIELVVRARRTGRR